jgi:cation:H+ antiporter
VVLFAVDFFYDGLLLASVSSTHAITVAAVVIVTAAVTMGMLYRAEKRFWVIEPDAVLVILMIAAVLLLVYRAGR